MSVRLLRYYTPTINPFDGDWIPHVRMDDSRKRGPETEVDLRSAKKTRVAQDGCSFTSHLGRLDIGNKEALFIATVDGNETLPRSLQERGIDPRAEYDEGETPLHDASANGHVGVVKTLLRYEANPDTVNVHGQTALHLGVISEQSEVVAFLLDHNATVDLQDLDLWSPLHYAVADLNLEIALILLEAGADPSLENETGQNALHLLLTEEETHETYRLLEELLNREIDVNKADHSGQTALHIAAQNSSIACITTLINHGALATLTDAQDQLPVNLSVCRGDIEIFRKLLATSGVIDIHKGGSYSFLASVLEPRSSLAVELFNSQQLRVTNRRDDNFFRKLCIMDHRRAIFLVEKTPYARLKTSTGASLLHDAVPSEDKEIVKACVDAGLLQSKNIRGETALHVAAGHGSHRMAQYLYELGADLYSVDLEGATPLHHAARHKKSRGVAFTLGRQQGHLSSVDNNGNTPLHEALLRGHEEVAELFIQRGADLTSENLAGETPLRIAASNGYHWIVEDLVDKGDDLTRPDRDGNTALHLTSLRERVRVLAFIVKNRLMDLSLENKDGNTALHLAFMSHKRDLVSEYAERDSKMEIDDHEGGWEDVDDDADEGEKDEKVEEVGGGREIIKLLLLENGADPLLRNRAGLSPLDLAVKSGCCSLRTFLQSGVSYDTIVQAVAGNE